MESGSIFPDLREVQNGEHFNTSTSSSGVTTAKKKRLTNLEKKDIVHRLSLNFCNGKLQRGSINTLATDFGVNRITIYTIWKDVQQAIKDGKMELPSVDRKYKAGNMTYVFDLEKVTSIPLHLRTNIRTLACQLKAGKSTVHRMIQKGSIKSHSNALKSYLTPINMGARVTFCLKHIESSTLRTNPTYIGMFSIVHIDEKWFYMTKCSKKYYLFAK